MTRTLDWSPLGLGSDPIPGEPEEVRQAAIRLRNTATAIQDAYDSIKQASDECGGLSAESEAVDTFMDQADDVADKLIKALPRYEAAAEALESYDDDLGEAQLLSATALTMAENARSTIDAEQAGDEPPGLFEETPGSQAMDDAHTKLQEAISLRDTSANSARNKIHNVIEDDDVKDSFWDNMGDFADLLSTISTWLGVAAIFLNFIPIIGQALAAIAGTLALVLGVVALVLHLGAAIENGEGWDAVIFDAIGVATFGVGRAAIGGARGLTATAQRMGFSRLRGISGISSRLNGSIFRAKGPFTAAQAAAYRTTSFPQGFARSALGGIGRDVGDAFNTIRTAGFSGWRSSYRMPTFGSIATGDDAIAGLLARTGGIRAFDDVAAVDDIARIVERAAHWNKVATFSFGLGFSAGMYDELFR